MLANGWDERRTPAAYPPGTSSITATVGDGFSNTDRAFMGGGLDAIDSVALVGASIRHELP